MSGIRWTEADLADYLARKDRAAVPVAHLESDLKPRSQRKNVGEEVYPRVRIHVHSKRRRLTDPDGVSAKSAIDGLVQGGLLKNDTAKEIESITFSQEKSEVEETIIEIEEIE